MLKRKTHECNITSSSYGKQLCKTLQRNAADIPFCLNLSFLMKVVFTFRECITSTYRLQIEYIHTLHTYLVHFESTSNTYDFDILISNAISIYTLNTFFSMHKCQMYLISIRIHFEYKL